MGYQVRIESGTPSVDVQALKARLEDILARPLPLVRIPQGGEDPVVLDVPTTRRNDEAVLDLIDNSEIVAEVRELETSRPWRQSARSNADVDLGAIRLINAIEMTEEDEDIEADIQTVEEPTEPVNNEESMVEEEAVNPQTRTLRSSATRWCPVYERREEDSRTAHSGKCERPVKKYRRSVTEESLRKDSTDYVQEQ